MIIFPGRHLMGVLEFYQLIPPNKMVELKTYELCVKNQVEFSCNKNEQMWVLRFFFHAKPTSTHTYCKKAIRESRCRFGRINISPSNFTSMKKKSRRTYIYSYLLFWRVPSSNYDQKKQVATCRLEWHYQFSERIMAFSVSNIEIQ